MFSEIGQTIFENEAVAKTFDFNMGLEVEMHRADNMGELSPETTPASISLDNPWITKDFTETMTEVVTPAANNARDAVHYLYSLNNALRNALAPNEVLWPLSMPPAFADAQKIQLAKTTPEKEAYLKRVLANMGAVNKGLPCGVHVSLSIDDRVVNMIWEKYQSRFNSKEAVRNHLYILLAQGFTRYRWLLTYLLGASPVAERNFFNPGDPQPDHPVRSLRQSHYGFDMRFAGDYTDVRRYVNRVLAGVKKKEIIDVAQFHGAIRLKSQGSFEEMEERGVNYIELRMLDLDPWSMAGIRLNTLYFLRIMASYFIMTPGLDEEAVCETITRANQLNEVVAVERPTEPTKYAPTALAFLERLELFASQLQLGPEYLEVLEDMTDRVNRPDLTPSGQMARFIKDGSLTEFGLRRALRYQKSALQSLATFKGFENMATPLSAEDLKKNLFRGSYEPSGLIQ